jgi:hypothetical protein
MPIKMTLVLVSLLFVAMSPDIFAKAQTSRITISGADLKAPIEITDPRVLINFNVWSGAGTSWTSGGVTTQGDRGFIVDWRSGAVTRRAKGRSSYQVSFYAKLPEERVIYVVFYEYDPANDKGYVYLPGKTEEWYRTNVSSILRGVEGHWFFSSEEWERFVRPLITKATSGDGLYPPGSAVHASGTAVPMGNGERRGARPMPPADGQPCELFRRAWAS